MQFIAQAPSQNSKSPIGPKDIAPSTPAIIIGLVLLTFAIIGFQRLRQSRRMLRMRKYAQEEHERLQKISWRRGLY